MNKLWIGSYMVYKQTLKGVSMNHIPFCCPGDWTRTQAIGFGYTDAKIKFRGYSVEVKVALVELSEQGAKLLEDFDAP